MVSEIRDRLLIVPAWLVSLACVPFLPETHPWHGRWFRLGDFARHATGLSYEFAIVFWVLGICMLSIVVGK